MKTYTGAGFDGDGSGAIRYSRLDGNDGRDHLPEGERRLGGLKGTDPLAWVGVPDPVEKSAPLRRKRGLTLVGSHSTPLGATPDARPEKAEHFLNGADALRQFQQQLFQDTTYEAPLR